MVRYTSYNSQPDRKVFRVCRWCVHGAYNSDSNIYHCDFLPDRKIISKDKDYCGMFSPATCFWGGRTFEFAREIRQFTKYGVWYEEERERRVKYERLAKERWRKIKTLKQRIAELEEK